MLIKGSLLYTLVVEETTNYAATGKEKITAPRSKQYDPSEESWRMPQIYTRSEPHSAFRMIIETSDTIAPDGNMKGTRAYFAWTMDIAKLMQRSSHIDVKRRQYAGARTQQAENRRRIRGSPRSWALLPQAIDQRDCPVFRKSSL